MNIIDNYQPLNGRILIEVLPPEKVKYEGELAIPEITKEVSNVGIVKALPLGYTGEVNHLQVGTKVLFNRHSGSAIKPNHLDRNAPEFRFIREEDLFAVIRDN